MKNAPAHTKKLNTLLKKLHSQYGSDIEQPHAMEPVAQLVVGFLEWEATRKQADLAYGRLMDMCVDVNDLRVSMIDELADAMGPRYPRVDERAARLKDALNGIYNREHATSLASLEGKAKREVKDYLESLPGMVPYVSARTLLVAFSGHAVPVDERLVSLLVSEGAADDEASIEEVASFLERTIKATDSLESHILLRAWADDAPAAKPAVKKKKTTKAATKKATTKSAASAARKKVTKKK